MAGPGSKHSRLIDIDLGYDALSKTLAEVGKTSSKAGLIRGSASNEVIEYGAKNQFGDPSTSGAPRPARPWLTQAWDAGGEEEYATLIVGSLEEYLETGDLSAVERGFLIAASVAEQDMRDSIKKGDFEPLAARTIAEKGNDIILIHSGELLRSIDSTVQEQKGPFKPADTQKSAAKVLLKPKRRTGAGTRKRGRKVGFRRRVGALGALAKSPGYEGRGIRKAPERRNKAAAGVASKGVRRRGLRF